MYCKIWETVVPTYASLTEKHFALCKKRREGVVAGFSRTTSTTSLPSSCHEFIFLLFT